MLRNSDQSDSLMRSVALTPFGMVPEAMPSKNSCWLRWTWMLPDLSVCTEICLPLKGGPSVSMRVVDAHSKSDSKMLKLNSSLGDEEIVYVDQEHG